MANPHSSVIYVEPNSEKPDWNLVGDEFERAPRLDDYCIALNLEVEVCSRTKAVGVETSVYIMSWDNKGDKVSFMSGTKIGGYDYYDNGLKRKAKLDSNNDRKDLKEVLTNYYADMYVGDLVNHGTTEMIGIKSVTIDYKKSCVPEITIQFTDVRGLSLFQPTELSRDNTFNGIKGISASNIAQSFFQCFYKMPLPKFTIYIKGFYGKPVSYEMMCDKFDTNFNSESGDFDITARFIGYSYSFLTDVSLDALLVAPYSDYVGKQYWRENVENGRFRLYDRTKTDMKEMPTLYEIKNDIELLLHDSNKGMQETTLTAEEDTHEEEIATLKSIRDYYSKWYDMLFNLLQKTFGNRYCFLFKEDGEDGDYYRIVVLANSKGNTYEDLGETFKQFPSDFKNLNENLCSLVVSYNDSNHKYKNLNELSIDFVDYKKQNIFNPCYVSSNREIKFGGFSKDCNLPKNEVISTMFNSGNTEYTLYTIYGDGVDQYIDGFVIDADYSDIKKRINALQRDANRSVDDKTKEKAVKEHNRLMLDKMKWYPSVENFTRIMLAHLETLMAMMFTCADETNGRTLKSLGVSAGDNGVSDTNGDEVVPPFPRVTKNVVGDDNIQKIEDDWVGDLVNGEGFREVDLINGIFNAVEYVEQLDKQHDKFMSSMNDQPNNETESLIKHPLTPFDFFLTRNPYGTDGNIASDPNSFAAKICTRMYEVLALNFFASIDKNTWNYTNSDFIKSIARSEAENFSFNFKLKDKRLLEMLSGSNDTAQLSAKNICELLSNGKSIDGNTPYWGNKALFDGNMAFNGYKTNWGNSIYPIQGMSLSDMDETLLYFNKSTDSVQAENDGIMVDKLDCNKLFYKLMNSNGNESMFNTLFIEDDFNIVKDRLDSSSSSNSDDYKKIYEILEKNSLFNDKEFSDSILQSGRTSFKEKIGFDGNRKILPYTGYTQDLLSLDKDDESKTYSINVGITEYGSEAENGNISDYTLTEAYGYKKVYVEKVGYKYEFDDANSLFCNVPSTVESIGGWGNGNQNVFDEKVVRMAFFVMSLKCIDHSNSLAVLNDKKKSFSYLPKLAVLQIGALASTLGYDSLNLNRVLDKAWIEKCLPVSWKDTNVDKVLKYVNTLNPLAKIAYIKYFVTWARENYSNIMLLDKRAKDVNTGKESLANAYYTAVFLNGSNIRRLFRERADYISTLTNGLMKPVLVAHGSVFWKASGSALKMDRTYAETYLENFLERLREINEIGYAKDDNGNITRIAETPKSTSKDMKKELYRYLKLLYDKWIPQSSLEDWKIEKFFDYENTDHVNGHLFHFIDSFYNKIGDKLLVNPAKLADKIKAAFDNNRGDIPVMMLGFMADIYAQNKCMMLSLQNFLDLSKEENMRSMFKPIPYNDMGSANKHPDFVIVYPYEPSKNLNVDNSEFKNDGFMLNDENDTPMAIRTREGSKDRWYKIPAFGVSYGKQYQSYFKNVSVNMQSPIATQQSILAKHSILRSMNNVEKTIVGQDLYDIYTTQSYTCKVEMMGCAWIQPLMYFVLLNVPMFRGSYMIFKVSHKITPGNMTTEFQGTRMSRFANTIVEDMFTDENDFGGAGQAFEESRRQAAADVGNDCPYKVYPLEENTSGKLSEIEIKEGKIVMQKLINKGFTEIAAAGIVGNMLVESTYEGKVLNPYALNKNSETLAAGLVQWKDNYYLLHDMLENHYRRYGHYDKNAEYTYESKYKSGNPNHVNAVIKALNKIPNLLDYQIDFLYNSIKNNNYSNFNSLFGKLNGCSTASDAARLFAEKYEVCNDKLSDRQNKAQDLYNNYMSTAPTTNASDSDMNNKDVRVLFARALNKSCKSTNAVTCRIKEDSLVTIDGKKMLEVRQDNGKTDNLATIFDIILNGYYNYVQTLIWCYSKDTSEEPITLYVEPSLHVKENNRLVFINNTKRVVKGINLNDKANEKLLRSLSKKYATLGDGIFYKEVPQMNGKYDLLGKFTPVSCGSVVGGGSSTLSDFSGIVTNPKMKAILSNLNKLCLKHRYNDSSSWRSVRDSKGRRLNSSLPICETGKCTYGPSTWYNYAGSKYDLHFWKEGYSPETALHNTTSLESRGMVMVWHGTVEEALALPTSKFRPGDVSTQHYYKKSHEDASTGRIVYSAPSSHACMWTGKDWRSDFVQPTIMASTKFKGRDNDYSVCLWRHPDLQEPNLPLV